MYMYIHHLVYIYITLASKTYPNCPFLQINPTISHTNYNHNLLWWLSQSTISTAVLGLHLFPFHSFNHCLQERSNSNLNNSIHECFPHSPSKLLSKHRLQLATNDSLSPSLTLLDIIIPSACENNGEFWPEWICDNRCSFIVISE